MSKNAVDDILRVTDPSDSNNIYENDVETIKDVEDAEDAESSESVEDIKTNVESIHISDSLKHTPSTDEVEKVAFAADSDQSSTEEHTNVVEAEGEFELGSTEDESTDVEFKAYEIVIPKPVSVYHSPNGKIVATVVSGKVTVTGKSVNGYLPIRFNWLGAGITSGYVKSNTIGSYL